MKIYHYVADFETTLEAPTTVWAYSVSSITEEKIVNNGDNITDFINFINKRNSDCFFHNLKFDGEFLLSYLLNNGFTYVEKKPKENEFSTIIDHMGTFYQIEVRWYNGKKTWFKDSFKLLPFSVRKIGKDFGIGETKGEIDFQQAQADNYKLTPERLDYVNRDVLVIAKALKKCYFDYGKVKMTIGANALFLYKTQFIKDFRKIFPELDKEVDRFFRKGYHGGFCWVNPKIQGQVLGYGRVFDVNSLYPYSMTKLLPYGKPLYFNGEYKQNKYYPLYVIRFRAVFKVKNGFIPFLQIKKNLSFLPTQFIEEVREITELTMTNVDFELFQKHYDITYLEYLDGYMFKGSTEFFKAYIEHFMEIKMKSTGAVKQRAKLFLNNLYGKFSTSPNNITKIPYIDNGEVRYKTVEGPDKKTVYLPVGMFTTAYGMSQTVSTAQMCYDRICYCDTDSIHILGNKTPNIKVDKVKLGYWDNEYNFVKARFVKPKTYFEITDEGDNIIKACGLPDSVKVKVKFDDFKRGLCVGGKLLPKRVVGGIILVDTDFTIK